MSTLLPVEEMEWVHYLLLQRRPDADIRATQEYVALEAKVKKWEEKFPSRHKELKELVAAID